MPVLFKISVFQFAETSLRKRTMHFYLEAIVEQSFIKITDRNNAYQDIGHGRNSLPLLHALDKTVIMSY